MALTESVRSFQVAGDTGNVGLSAEAAFAWPTSPRDTRNFRGEGA